MAVSNNKLDWGKCKIEIDKGVTTSTNKDAQTKTIDQVQENTTSLNTEQGDKKEAIIEGGEVLATRYQRNKYTLEWVEFGKPSLTNDDGIVAGTHKVTVICQDSGKDEEVFTFPSAVINVQPQFSSEYGTVTKYTAVAQRTESGSIVWAGASQTS